MSKFIFFSEHGHVAYQIKGNDACSNMVANILTADPSPRPLGFGQKVKIQLLLEYDHFAYQTCSNMEVNILPADAPSRPWEWGQMVYIQLFFLKIKSICISF